MRKLYSIFLALLMLFMVIHVDESLVYAAEPVLETSLISNELQEKENVANEKYNILLKEWAINSQVIDDTNANFPAFYGGAYINDYKELVIQVTELNEDILAYFSGLIDLEDVVLEEVEYSYEELIEQHDDIASKMNENSSSSLITQIAGVGISIPDNAVSLYIVGADINAKSTDLQSEVQNQLSTFDNIKIIATSEKDTPASAVQPGTKISSNGRMRSVGFWAEDSSGNLGIVTAPHNTMSEGTIVTVDSETFGTAGTPHFSGSVDAVFIQRTNNDFTPSRYVSGGGFSLYSNGVGILAVGSTTYSKGITSGYRIGEVIDTNYSTAYGISNCVITSAPCESGDSGGIVAGNGNSSNRYVAGIITGKQGGTGYIMYVKASNILSTLGVTVY